ncbi:LysM peptidoglycan-binding domain-containing protein [Blastococcus litoris]|uniref:LysM peptidoglycan-binding domain-containing protein n=1 Tax=Blastococcus litoris TaxID=2171622 RepID=UPI000E307E5E|nr:LysM peptidoglycan-binding domain-containing protein [Blastococcus litoris]
MTTSPRFFDPLRRLLAALALGAVVFGVPIALWGLGGSYLPDRVPSWTQVTAALTGPDTGAVFLGLLVLIGWAAWAAFAVSVVAEMAVQLRGLPPVDLPGLRAPQQLAGVLVAAVIGVGAAPLLLTPALAIPPVVAEQPIEEWPAPSPDRAPAAEPAPPASTGPTYTVQPRDTLGRIAARHLGDWARFDEILDLNLGRLQPDGGTLTDPGLIRPGWTLVLPADADLPGSDPAAAQVTVQSGDTLADIAAEHRIDGWQPIFDLNAGEPQPGGGRFTDPDVIRPGQVLDLPHAAAPEPTHPVPPVEADPATPPAIEDAPNPAGPPRGQVPIPDDTSNRDQAEAADSDAAAGGDAADTDRSPAELAIVLTGSGALLAAGLGAAWLAHRRQRLRRRRPGRTLTPLPAELSEAQAAVRAGADTGNPDYAALDHALRALAVALSDQPDARLPDVVAARLGADRLDLRLQTPGASPPPAPWAADPTGLWWSIGMDEDTGVEADRAAARLAPYPTLVTVGAEDGRRWLLDLERIGVLRISGPAERREQFARHVAAELAVNSWSDLLTVTPVGFGGELIDLAPDRIHVVAQASDVWLQGTLRQAAEQQDGDVLQGRLRAEAGDGWMPTVVLAPHAPDSDGGELAELIATLDNRDIRGATAVLLGAHPTGDAPWTLTVTDDGHLLVPDLELRLPTPQLTAQQASDIAALLSFERDAGDAPVPAADGDQPWQDSTDAAGALREDLTLPRTLEAAEEKAGPPSEAHAPWAPAVSDSPLPQPPDTYLQTSPATPEDIAVLGRRAPTELRRRLETDLELLDHDLADWWAPDCTRPRLTLLGPITLRAHGDEAAVTKSGLRRRYEEVVAYLATRPHGATVDEAATALQPARSGRTDPVSARAYVHRVTAGARGWLGTDPATGEKHLSSGHRGPYTLTNVLVDADLFRQLRARAGARGSDGMPDLLAALALVSGPPFAQRPAGYEWLGGLELTYTAAICDVAHLVVTSALADDDLDAARTASATALLVAPDDEKVLLDAMWVAYREGNRAEAETYVARIVDVHDGEDEMDLPMSTAEIINRARRQYLDRAS